MLLPLPVVETGQQSCNCVARMHDPHAQVKICDQSILVTYETMNAVPIELQGATKRSQMHSSLDVSLSKEVLISS